MIRSTRNFKRSGESRARGAAAVEMAIMAPLLILLFGGIISFGLFFFLKNNMVNAAREGTRALAVGEVTVAGSTSCDPDSPPPAGSAQEVVCSRLSGWSSLNFTLAVCSPAVPGPNCVGGSNDVAVEISLPLSEAVTMDVLGLFESGTTTALVIMRQE